MRNLSFSLVTIIAFQFTVVAQQDYPLIQSGEIIKQGVILHDSGQYKKALVLYNQVTRNDSNYVRALYEKAVTLAADSQFKESLRVSQLALGLATQRELEPQIYNLYGNNLLDLREYNRAKAVYDSGIYKYPAFPLLYSNRAIVLMNQDSLEEAERYFSKTIMINPYHYSAHYNLGLVALQQGKIVPAFISFIGYLLMNPEGRYSSHIINLLADIANTRDNIIEYKNKRTKEPGESYQAMEEILLSKIALDNQYKPVIHLDDAISRQIQVMFEKLEYNESDPDFYIQYYLPYFKQVFSNGQFELFINHIFSSANVKEIQNYNKNHKKEGAALLESAAAYFNLIRNTRELTFTKRSQSQPFYLYDGANYLGKGKLVNKNQTSVGPWEYTYPAGNLKSIGRLNEQGKREGEWRYYFENGKLKATENYLNGNLEGKLVTYFHNGIVSSESEYRNNKLEGISMEYYLMGTSMSSTHYNGDKKEGEQRSYYANGDLHWVYQYSLDVLNGPYQVNYQSGQLSESGTYKEGKLDGPSKSYHENGKTSVEGNFIKGKREGEWKTYYGNGHLKEKEFYENGLPEGSYEKYFDNGQLSTKFNNRKGKANGEIIYNDKDGKKTCAYFFEKDIIKSARYFDKSGKQIFSAERKDKRLDMTVFSPEGIKLKQLSYNEKGNVDGPETSYYPSGAINEKAAYRDDELNGPYVSYFPNGNKKLEVNITSGKKDGFYKEYYAHGQLESEGWYIDDQMQGDWIFFDEQGNINSKAYYINGELGGFKEDFRPDGKKYLEQRYQGGWLEEIIQYDSLGIEIHHDEFPTGAGKYVQVLPEGRKLQEGTFAHGAFDGKFTTYYFDGSISAIQYFKKGFEDSIYQSYFFGGKISSEGKYRLGKKTGTWKRYEEDGKLYATEDYAEGSLNGSRIYYFKDGKKDTEIPYKDGQRNGLFKKYDNDGTLLYQIRYEDDVPIAYTFLDSKGQLKPELPILPGKTKFQTYYPNGSLSREFAFLDGKGTGPDLLYFQNGHPRQVSKEEYGLTEGNLKEYHPNGQLKIECTYLHDNVNGIYKEFNEKGILQVESNWLNGNLYGNYIKYDDAGHVKERRKYYYGLLLGVQKI